MTKRTPRVLAPTLRSLPFLNAEESGRLPRLTDNQRQMLLAIATRIDLRPRGFVYREHAAAGALFVCGEGAVKSFRDLPDGKRRIVAFLFRGDVFGLAENGRYVNTVQATMPTICYRLPLEQLVPILLQDPQLEFHLLLKVTHELRESQRHGILISRRSAKGRLATFLKMLEATPVVSSVPGTIAVPMSRTDIADYLGLTIESVSRATRELTEAGIIEFKGARAVQVIDRHRFERIAVLA